MSTAWDAPVEPRRSDEEYCEAVETCRAEFAGEYGTQVAADCQSESIVEETMPLPYGDFSIGAFRGLRAISLDGCTRVNVLVGGNNSGKTSLLEALLLLADPFNPNQWGGAIEMRTTWPLIDGRFGLAPTARLDALSWLFPHEQGEPRPLELCNSADSSPLIASMTEIVGVPPDKPVFSAHEVVETSFARRRAKRGGDEEEMEESGLIIEMNRGPDIGQGELFAKEGATGFRMVLWDRGSSRRRTNGDWPSIPSAFVTPISHRSDGYLAARLSRILRKRQKPRAVELLRQLDPRIRDLVIVSPDTPESDRLAPRMGSAPTLHIETEDTGLVPVHALGDGVRRALHLAIVLAGLEPGGVLLIDEVEVGMHTSVLTHVFAWLAKACEQADVQLFSTTHSLEAVDALLEATPDEELTVFRLASGKVRRFEGSQLRVARTELGQEIR